MSALTDPTQASAVPPPIDDAMQPAVSVTVDPEETRQQREESKAHREEKKRKFFERMHRQFQTAKNADATWRENAEDDQLFEAGSLSPKSSTHWDAGMQQTRATQGRPCLTINRMPTFVHQVTAQHRVQRPSITVNPYDNGADPDTAQIFQGMCRQIETSSDADVAYLRAGDNQARVGRGWIEICAEFTSDTSMDMDLRIRSILNPFCIYRDPAAVEFDYADMRFAFKVDQLGKDDYKTVYGKDAPDTNDFNNGGYQGAITDWSPEGKSTIAQYYWIDYVDDRLFLMQDGSTQLLSKMQEAPRSADVVRTRVIQRRQVKMAIVDGVRILEGEEPPPDAGDDWEPVDGRDWPGDRIPLFPVLGEERSIKGDVDYRGVVRDGKDPNRAYDFWVTALTEKIALEPKAPYIVDMRAIAEYKGYWDTASTTNYAYLPVNLSNPDDPTKDLAAPSRLQTDPAGINAMVMAIRQADEDMKSTTGFYDPSLGNNAGQQSGRAILAQQQQGNAGASFFQDNMAKAVRSVGRALVQLIPHYYPEPRVVRILGIDDKPTTVMVHAGNPPSPEQQAQFMQQQGIQPPPQQDANPLKAAVTRIYDLSAGRYDVSVSTGPSYASQQERDNQTLGSLITAVPPIGMLAADIIVENTSLRGKDTLVKRLKKANPMLDDDAQNAAPQIPPQVQAQMQQGMQVIQQLQGQVQQMQQAEQAKSAELQTRIEIAKIQAQTQLMVEMAKIDMARAKTEIQVQLDAYQADLDRGHAFALQNQSFAQQAALQHLGGQQDAAQAAQEQTHDASMAAMTQSHQRAMQDNALAAQAAPSPSDANAAAPAAPEA